MKQNNKDRLLLIFAMVIFSTIGIFRKFIPLPSSVLAMARGVIGMAFLFVWVSLKNQRVSREAVRNNLLVLILSGIALPFNWMLLFEAYNYTSVATATLCYYMAPIFLILVSPVLFREKLTVKKLICVAVALVGMAMVSGVFDEGLGGISGTKGILLGLGAAVLYTTVMVLNRYLKDISAYDKTIMQLGLAAVVMLPYVLLTEDLSAIRLDIMAVVMLLVVGIIHTGVAYACYFGSIGALPAQTVALFSYIDPVGAIILSALVLREPMSMWGAIGAVLVLGSTLVSELPEKAEKGRDKE